MGESNPKRSGWIYVGGAAVLCLLALLLFRMLGQSFEPDPFTVKLDDLFDETPAPTVLVDDGFRFSSLHAFDLSLKASGFDYAIMTKQSETTVIYDLAPGKGYFSDERIVCSLDGAGNVTAFTIELWVIEKPAPLGKHAGQFEREYYALQMEENQKMPAKISVTLSACMQAYGLDQTLSYAEADRMDAFAQAALTNKKASFHEEGGFRLGSLYKEHDGEPYVHLSMEKMEKGAKGGRA